MSPSLTVAISAVSTVLLGAVAHALILPLLRNHQVIDIPNHRSSHTTPTVRGGGLGIIVALVGGLVLGAALLHPESVNLKAVIWFGVTVVAFATLGWAEDARGLPVSVRLAGQVVISVAAAMSATAIGGLPVGLALLAVVGGVFYVNAANFMDGVNGISAWHGTVVGAFFATIGLLDNSTGLMLAGLVTAAAFLSFLPWNAPRARMFMGDVGSYALGATAWALCVLAVIVGTPLLVAVAPLMIYASDVVFTLLKRARHHAPLLSAHREHTYQRVEQITGSHAVATALTTTASGVCAAIGVLGKWSSGMTLWALPLIALVVVLYLATPTLLSTRRAGPTTMEVDA